MNPPFLPAIHEPAELFRFDGDAVLLWHDGSSREVMRERIAALKDRLLVATAEHRQMPLEHLLADGMYLRKLFIPKGTVVVGKIHLKACMNIVAKGDISVLTEIAVGRFQAGEVAVSAPGTQKVGYAHEDTVFINVFRTDKTDLAEIEREIASDSLLTVESNSFGELPCL